MKCNKIWLSTELLIGMLLVIGMLIPLAGYSSDLDEELISAALDGNTDTVEALLAKGAGVNAKDKLGNTALFCAVKSDNIETVQALLVRGADVNAKNIVGEPPLVWAAARVLHGQAVLQGLPGVAADDVRNPAGVLRQADQEAHDLIVCELVVG